MIVDERNLFSPGSQKSKFKDVGRVALPLEALEAVSVVASIP